MSRSWLADLRSVFSPKMRLAVTAALEHYTATFARSFSPATKLKN